MTFRDLREALIRRGFRSRPDSIPGTPNDKTGLIGRQAIIPIHKTKRLTNLPELNADLTEHRPFYAAFMAEMYGAQRDLNKAVQRQLFFWEGARVDTERFAWDDAVAWIERRHAPEPPEEPVVFDWAWPESRPVLSDPRRGSGDLAVDWDDEDEDW